jgi:hypothetical protein
MSCTYYDFPSKTQTAHDGVCEASTEKKDVYLCRHTDGEHLAQHQSGCEWKVKRFREWQLQHRQSK